MSDITPQNANDERILKMREQGLSPRLRDVGIKLDATERYEFASTLARIGDDMVKAVDEVSMSYLVKYFPQLQGVTRDQAIDWLSRKKVLFSAVKQEKAIEGGSVIWFAAFSQKYKVRRCFEVRCQVLSSPEKPGQVALKLAHKEVPFPEDLGIVERSLFRETKDNA